MKSSKIIPSANSTIGEFRLNRRLAKKRVQWLNEALCFVSSSVLADSLVLRNPLLRQAPKRYVKIKRIKWKNGNQMFG